MTMLALRKMPNGTFVPAGPEEELVANRIKPLQVIRTDWKRVRNYAFLQKWFCLARFAFDHWEPKELQSPRYRGVVPEKSFSGFRKDLIILSGYYDAYYRVNGDVRIEAKSISFENMEQAEFERLYSATIDAVLKHVLTHYTRDDLDEVVEQALGYAS